MENMKEKLLRLMNEYPAYEVKFVVGEELCADGSNSICDIADITVDALAEYGEEELLDYDDYSDNGAWSVSEEALRNVQQDIDVVFEVHTPSV